MERRRARIDEDQREENKRLEKILKLVALEP